jgi:hypothetical protein
VAKKGPKAFYLSAGIKFLQEFLLAALLSNIVQEIIVNAVKEGGRKEWKRKMKRRQLIEKKEVLSSLFTDDMILYVENPNIYTFVLELINSIELQGIKSIYKIQLYYVY